MFKSFLAFRYLTSRPISLVSIIGIFLSVGALIVVISVMSGFLRDTKAFIRGTMSDIVITPDRYVKTSDGRIVQLTAKPFEQVQEIIENVPDVIGAAPRFVRPALITCSDQIDYLKGSSKYSDLNFTKVLGIDQLKEKVVSGFDKMLTNVEGSWGRVDQVEDPFYVSDDHKPVKYLASDYPSILLGKDRFERLRLNKGDVITLATLDESAVEEVKQDKNIKAFEQNFFVAGAFSSGNHQFDMEFVIIDMRAAWNWVKVENEINEIFVAVNNYEERGLQICEEIEAALREINYYARIETWEERNSVFLGAVENERTILGVILAFFIIIATFNVYATISMMVTDKTKDIGILVSMGATSIGIMKTFIYCGLFMWLIGSTLGAIAGYLFAKNINAIKDFLENLLGVEIFRQDVYNFKNIPVEVSFSFILMIIIGTFFMCLFFSMLPAMRASLMDPVKALRHE